MKTTISKKDYEKLYSGEKVFALGVLEDSMPTFRDYALGFSGGSKQCKWESEEQMCQYYNAFRDIIDTNHHGQWNPDDPIEDFLDDFLDYCALISEASNETTEWESFIIFPKYSFYLRAMEEGYLWDAFIRPSDEFIDKDGKLAVQMEEGYLDGRIS